MQILGYAFWIPSMIHEWLSSCSFSGDSSSNYFFRLKPQNEHGTAIDWSGYEFHRHLEDWRRGRSIRTLESVALNCSTVRHIFNLTVVDAFRSAFRRAFRRAGILIARRVHSVTLALELSIQMHFCACFALPRQGSTFF